jgi:hypothetical protein
MCQDILGVSYFLALHGITLKIIYLNTDLFLSFPTFFRYVKCKMFVFAFLQIQENQNLMLTKETKP